MTVDETDIPNIPEINKKIIKEIFTENNNFIIL